MSLSKYIDNTLLKAIATPTGFGTGGATLEDVQLMKSIVGESMRIKASGSIKNAETAKEYLALGISRIGTSFGIDNVS